MPRQLRPLAAFLSVLALLALPACGGGDDGGTTATADGSNVIAVAAEDTRAAGSSKVAFSATVGIAGEQEPVELTGEGEFDYEQQVGRLTFDFGALLGSLGALGESVSTEAEIIFDSSVIYLNFPLLSNLLPGAKPWIKIDPQQVPETGGFDLSALAQAGQNDPSQLLAYLGGAENVQEVGTETVRGEETTHYTATVDLRKAVESAPPELQAQLEQSVAQLEESGKPTVVPVDVWIADDGLIRRVTIDYSAAASETAEPVQNTITMEFFDYGTEVTAEPPPADEVVDIAELSGLLGGGDDGATTP